MTRSQGDGIPGPKGSPAVHRASVTYGVAGHSLGLREEDTRSWL